MVWTTAVVLLAFWVLGLTGAYAMEGLVDVVLVLPIGLLLVNLIVGRRAI